MEGIYNFLGFHLHKEFVMKNYKMEGIYNYMMGTILELGVEEGSKMVNH